MPLICFKDILVILIVNPNNHIGNDLVPCLVNTARTLHLLKRINKVPKAIDPLLTDPFVSDRWSLHPCIQCFPLHHVSDDSIFPSRW